MLRVSYTKIIHFYISIIIIYIVCIYSYYYIRIISLEMGIMVHAKSRYCIFIVNL